MKLHKYKSYEEYRDIQIGTNEAKIRRVWVIKENIEFISTEILRELDKPTFGICHGTRRGLEQKWFSECLGCQVIGTEISPTAGKFSSTIKMDFHKLVPGWHRKADFVYSNSYDHAYDPKRAFTSWFDTLKLNGMLILEHSSRHIPDSSSPTDPFGVTIDELIRIIPEWTTEEFYVKKVLRAPVKKKGVGSIYYVIITRI